MRYRLRRRDDDLLTNERRLTTDRHHPKSEIGRQKPRIDGKQREVRFFKLSFLDEFGFKAAARDQHDWICRTGVPSDMGCRDNETVAQVNPVKTRPRLLRGAQHIDGEKLHCMVVNPAGLLAKSGFAKRPNAQRGYDKLGNH